MRLRLHKKYGVNPTVPICFFCGKEKGEVVLLGAAYKGEAPMHLCIDKSPCDECKKMMEVGVMLISVREGSDEKNPYRTGALAIIKPEAAKRIFGDSIGDSRVAFVVDEAWDKLGLPRENKGELPNG